MLYTYESATVVVTSALGLSALTLGYSWLTYRLSTLTETSLTRVGVLDLSVGLYTYLWFLLPWVAILHTVRSYGGVSCSAGLGCTAVTTQRILLGVQAGVMALISLRWAHQTSTRWVLELLAAWLLLQLCWVLLNQAYSVLTALL